MSWLIEIDGSDEQLLVEWRNGQPAIDSKSPLATRLQRWFRGEHEFPVGLEPAHPLATADFDVEDRKIASAFELAMVAYRASDLPGVCAVRVERRRKARGSSRNSARDG